MTSKRGCGFCNEIWRYDVHIDLCFPLIRMSYPADTAVYVSYPARRGRSMLVTYPARSIRRDVRKLV